MITPQAFRYTEDEFLCFLRGRDIECGRRDELDPVLRKIIVGTPNLDRYAPDIWANCTDGPGVVYCDLKTETKRNRETGNGAIELRPLLRARRYQSTAPTVFVHHPDWHWGDADVIVAGKIWSCCDECFALFDRDQIPPEKCPNRSGGGSGDPHLVYRLKTLKPIDDLLYGPLPFHTNQPICYVCRTVSDPDSYGVAVFVSEHDVAYCQKHIPARLRELRA